MSQNEEFLNANGVLESVPSRIDRSLYNYDPGYMTPGMIWYRGSRYTEFKYLLKEGVLHRFEFSSQKTTWLYDGIKFSEGRLVRGNSTVPQSSIVETQPELSPQFVNIFYFDLSVLDRIKDYEVMYVTSELRRAWARRS
jgi:hypothetical protein